MYSNSYWLTYQKHYEFNFKEICFSAFININIYIYIYIYIHVNDISYDISISIIYFFRFQPPINLSPGSATEYGGRATRTTFDHVLSLENSIRFNMETRDPEGDTRSRNRKKTSKIYKIFSNPGHSKSKSTKFCLMQRFKQKACLKEA